MKKLLTLLFAAGMLSIYSCGGSSESTEQAADSTAAPATEQVAPAPPADSGAATPDTTKH